MISTYTAPYANFFCCSDNMLLAMLCYNTSTRVDIALDPKSQLVILV